MKSQHGGGGGGGGKEMGKWHTDQYLETAFQDNEIPENKGAADLFNTISFNSLMIFSSRDVKLSDPAIVFTQDNVSLK